MYKKECYTESISKNTHVLPRASVWNLLEVYASKNARKRLELFLNEPINLYKQRRNKHFIIERVVTMTDVENIIQQMKPDGPFQIVLTLIMCVIHGPGAMTIWLTNFVATQSPQRCSYNSTTCLSNQTYNDDQICSMNRTDWEYVASPKSTITVYFDTQCSGMWTTYLASSSLFIGWAIGGPFLSYIADKRGRKYVVFPAFFGVTLFGFLSIFSPNVFFFIATRLTVGLCIPGNCYLLFLFVGEFVDNKTRPVVINVVFVAQVVWMSLLCLAAYLINDWKTLTTITTLPFLLGLLSYPFVPETLHWLHTHGHSESFMDVLQKISHWNKVAIPENINSSAIEDDDGNASKSSLLKVFCTRDVFWLSMKLCYMWFATAVLFYGISISAENLTGSFYRDFFIVISVEVPSHMFTMHSCEHLGRKKTVWGNTFVASVCCIAVAFIPEVGSIRFCRLVLGAIGKFSITIAYNTYFVWVMELYGTEIRANAMGICNIACRIGGASAPWIAKGLMYYSRMASFIVMGSVGVVAGCMAMTLPETKGLELKTVSKSKRNNVKAHTNAGLEVVA